MKPRIAFAMACALLPLSGLAMTAGELQQALGTEKICANLQKGDYAAASEPIARKTAARRLTFPTVNNWLARQISSPYVEIPRSPLFEELPKDQGKLKTCVSKGFTLTGEEVLTDLHLEYPKSRLTVALRYSTGKAAPTLQFITIGKPEPIKNAAPPESMEQKMWNFSRALKPKKG